MLRTRWLAFLIALVAVFTGTSLVCYATGMRGVPSFSDTVLIRGIEQLQNVAGWIPGFVAMFLVLVGAAAAIVMNCGMFAFLTRTFVSLLAGLLLSIMFGTFGRNEGGALGVALGGRLSDVMSSPIASLLCGVSSLLALWIVFTGNFRDFSSIRNLSDTGPTTGGDTGPKTGGGIFEMFAAAKKKLQNIDPPAEPESETDNIEIAAPVAVMTIPPSRIAPDSVRTSAVKFTATEFTNIPDPEVRLLPKREPKTPPADREGRGVRSRTVSTNPSPMIEASQETARGIEDSNIEKTNTETTKHNEADAASNMEAERPSALSLESSELSISAAAPDGSIAGAAIVPDPISVAIEPRVENPNAQSEIQAWPATPESGVAEALRGEVNATDDPSHGNDETPSFANAIEIGVSGESVGLFDEPRVEFINDLEHGVSNDREIRANSDTLSATEEAPASERESYKNKVHVDAGRTIEEESVRVDLKLASPAAADVETEDISWDLPRTIQATEIAPDPKLDLVADDIFSEIRIAIESAGTLQAAASAAPPAKTRIEENAIPAEKAKPAEKTKTKKSRSLVNKSPAPAAEEVRSAPVEVPVDAPIAASVDATAPAEAMVPTATDLSPVPAAPISPPLASANDLLDRAARLVITERRASISFLQRKLAVSLGEAQHQMAALEAAGVVGPYRGNPSRDILLGLAEWDERRS
ncbi:MAG: hypothetical protein HY286_19410 [Planctomycetes bacterium]|nr:hypothetical protein [Planctomycetota bacterium]